MSHMSWIRQLNRVEHVKILKFPVLSEILIWHYDVERPKLKLGLRLPIDFLFKTISQAERTSLS
jgi:hypothetical protein